MSILSFSNLSYSYDKKKNIFSNISAEMELGKIYAILGPSGCGKTTLLSLLGGLDSPTKGKILFNGEDITEKGFANHRRNHVSFQDTFYKFGRRIFFALNPFFQIRIYGRYIGYSLVHL